MSSYAYVSLLYGNSPAFLHSLVMGKSLVDSGTQHDRILLYRSDVPDAQLEQLRRYFNRCIQIDEIPVPAGIFAFNIGRRLLGVFEKLHVFNLTDYSKILVLDSDIIVAKNIDHLFGLSAPSALLHDERLFGVTGSATSFSVARDRFETGRTFINAGVMLLEPSSEDFSRMVEELRSPRYTHSGYRFPEEIFLTGYFAGRWHSLGHRYNYRTDYLVNRRKRRSMTDLLHATPLDQISVIHYVSALKPYYFYRHRELLAELNLSEQERHLLGQLDNKVDRTDFNLKDLRPEEGVNFIHLYHRWIAEAETIVNELAAEGVDVFSLFEPFTSWAVEERGLKKPPNNKDKPQQEPEATVSKAPFKLRGVGPRMTRIRL